MTWDELPLWLGMAALTALVVLFLLRPLLRPEAPAVPVAPAPDLAIYRDQLDEIERDQSAGRLPEAEAEQARREVQRRLLKAGQATAVAAPARAPSNPPARVLALILLLLLPVLGLGGYLLLGRPDLPAQPLAGRDAELADYRRYAEEVRSLRAHLQAEPNDALAWRQLGLTLILLDETEAAIAAIETALAAGAPEGETFTLVAEAIIRKNDGIVVPMARQMLARALQSDPDDWLALFLTGFALEQDGRPDVALEVWLMIEREAGEGLPWSATLRQQIERLEARGVTPSVVTPPGGAPGATP